MSGPCLAGLRTSRSPLPLVIHTPRSPYRFFLQPYAFGICLLSIYLIFIVELVAFRWGTARLERLGLAHDAHGHGLASHAAHGPETDKATQAHFPSPPDAAPLHREKSADVESAQSQSQSHDHDHDLKSRKDRAVNYAHNKYGKLKKAAKKDLNKAEIWMYGQLHEWIMRPGVAGGLVGAGVFLYYS